MAGDDNSSAAKERLEKVQQHLSNSGAGPSSISNEPKPNTSKRRARRKSAESQLPADYSDILGQVAILKKIAATPDPNNRGYQRQKKAGKLWVRERVEAFCDPGTFHELGSVSGTVKWKQVGPETDEPVDCRFKPCFAYYSNDPEWS
jgi:hypothetical protein